MKADAGAAPASVSAKPLSPILGPKLGTAPGAAAKPAGAAPSAGLGANIAAKPPVPVIAAKPAATVIAAKPVILIAQKPEIAASGKPDGAATDFAATAKGTTTPLEKMGATVPTAGGKAKSDTSRVRLEAAKAASAAKTAPAGILGQMPGTIRLRKPGEGGVDVAIKPTGAAPAAKPVVAAAAQTPAAGPKAAAPAGKADTSRVRLEAAVPSVGATPPGDVQTMRMKKPPLAPPTALDAELAGGGELGGPKTIRLKKPDGTMGGIGKKGETVRIMLEDEGAGAPSGEAKTVQIKRTGGAAGEDQGSKTAKTIKVKRSGAPAGGEEKAPVGEDGTLKFKRAGQQVSDRSQRLADEETALHQVMGKIRKPGDDSEKIWICLVAFAALVVMSVILWVFSVQLFPTEKSLNWPGRILSANDAFYKGEGKWL